MYSFVVFQICDDVFILKYFMYYCPFVGESTSHRCIPLTKGQ